MQPAGRGRLPHVAALDGIRALAVAGVLLYHGGVSWLPGGFLGVDVFFVLSGFLITSLLLAEREATGAIDLARFWMRRARRLLPAAFTVIGVSLIVVAIFFPDDAARTRDNALASFAYVNNWRQIFAEQSYFESFGRPSPLQHLWSLAVEEQFYLVWPVVLGFVLSRLGRWRTMLVTLLLAIASSAAMALALGTDPSRVYFGTDTHASGLLIGALVAFAWPLGKLRPAPRAAPVLDAAAIIGFLGVLAAMAGVRDYDPFAYHAGIPLAVLASALLIAAVSHPSCRVAAVLGLAPLRWIGDRSYGIYLWHWPVMVLADIALVLQIAGAVLLAAVSYRWIEMPVRTGSARAWLDARTPRRRLGIAVGTVVILAATVGAAGARTPDTPPPTPLATTRSAAAGATPRPAAVQTPLKPLAVGASVMLGASPELEQDMTVDAAVGRQFPDILARLESYRAAGRLPGQVIVQIGENGPVFDSDIDELKRVLSGVDRVVLVNVRVSRSWESDVNDRLENASRTWPQARLADWFKTSHRPGMLYDDDTHPVPRGQRAYARLIERALD